MAEGEDIKKATQAMEELKLHEKATEERERRYFYCKDCDHHWWTNVPKDRPVSQCRECKTDYDAIPYELQPLLGKHTCSCGNTFVGWTSEGVKSPCYKCRENILPEEFLTPRPIRRKTSNTHNCNVCNGNGNCPNKRPVVPSRVHKET